jgi:hypothetical protein
MMVRDLLPTGFQNLQPLLYDPGSCEFGKFHGVLFKIVAGAA